MQSQSNYNDVRNVGKAENLYGHTESTTANQGQTSAQFTTLNEPHNYNSDAQPGVPKYFDAIDNSNLGNNDQSSNFNTQDRNRGHGINISDSAFSASNTDNINLNRGHGINTSNSAFSSSNSGNNNTSATYDYLGSGPAVGSGGIFQGSEITSDLSSGAGNANVRSGNDFDSTTGRTRVGEGLEGQKSYGRDQSGDSVGGSNTQAVPKSGNSTIDNAVGQLGNKLDQQTDKDGFTNLTGDKSAPGILTGRVKNDANTSEPPVVETTSERSERDAQGRELDSYGKPYEL